MPHSHQKLVETLRLSHKVSIVFLLACMPVGASAISQPDPLEDGLLADCHAAWHCHISCLAHAGDSSLQPASYRGRPGVRLVPKSVLLVPNDPRCNPASTPCPSFAALFTQLHLCGHHCE